MRLIVSPRAERRLEELLAYIACESPSAAVRLAARIDTILDVLTDNPKLGAPLGEYRRSIYVSRTPYRIIYRILEEAQLIEVLTFVHTSEHPDLQFE